MERFFLFISNVLYNLRTYYSINAKLLFKTGIQTSSLILSRNTIKRRAFDRIFPLIVQASNHQHTNTLNAPGVQGRR